MSASIQAEQLTVRKDTLDILHELNLEVQSGHLTGLIGPSGSGKTTLLRSIVGAQRFQSGRLLVDGLPAGSKRLRSQIGYMTQSPAVYDDLTVTQNLMYFAGIASMTGRAAKSRVAQLLGDVDLRPQAKQIVSSLSGGQRARVSLAIALLSDAAVLILDEPTVGLDPVLRRDLWSLFQKLADSGRTIVVSSHVMDEAERCADLILLRAGQVLYQGPKQHLLQETKTSSVEAAFLQLIDRQGRGGR